jgi:hypothetical protein
MNPDESRYIRHVNYVLRRNRRILMELGRKGMVNIPGSTLMHAGFDFKFITNISNMNGDISYHCYEFGYRESPNGIFTLVEKININDTFLIY